MYVKNAELGVRYADWLQIAPMHPALLSGLNISKLPADLSSALRDELIQIRDEEGRRLNDVIEDMLRAYRDSKNEVCQ